jgi:hypothetical protein
MTTMSAKHQELAILGLLSALVSVLAWETDYMFACFIFGWLTYSIVLLFIALRRFGDDDRVSSSCHLALPTLRVLARRGFQEE